MNECGSWDVALECGWDKPKPSPVDISAVDISPGGHPLEQTRAMSDRTYLETLLIALDASPIALGRPNCRGWVGDYQITGKHGHVLADGVGYLLYATTPERDRRDPDGKIRTYGSPRRWTNVKRQLSFCRLMQDGDDEGCLHLDRLPTEAEAKLIREALGIRRRRHLSPEALAQARSALELAAGRAKSPVPEPGSAQVATGDRLNSEGYLCQKRKIRMGPALPHSREKILAEKRDCNL
jgi:hypothetical protein